ncbi:hypothetical protein GE061_017182, partial [Apolygus lucorum]
FVIVLAAVASVARAGIVAGPALGLRAAPLGLASPLGLAAPAIGLVPAPSASPPPAIAKTVVADQYDPHPQYTSPTTSRTPSPETPNPSTSPATETSSKASTPSSSLTVPSGPSTNR